MVPLQEVTDEMGTTYLPTVDVALLIQPLTWPAMAESHEGEAGRQEPLVM